MAYKELMTNQNESSDLDKSPKNSFLLFFQTLFLTFLSPVSILFFIHFFSELNLSKIGQFESFLMIVGIFLGSVFWYSVLGSVLLIFRKHLSEKWIDNSRYFSAFILIVLGLWSIGSIL
jgi:threonine/homoserine/homoserine lactone efflux protein